MITRSTQYLIAAVLGVALTACGSGRSDLRAPTDTHVAAPRSVAISPSSAFPGLPAHVLIGYWHQPSAGVPALPLSQVSDDWDVIVVAFADPQGDGKYGFVPDPAAGSLAQFKADIKAKQRQGKKIVLALGDQQRPFALASQTEAEHFFHSMTKLVDDFGFDGIDLNVDNSEPASALLQTYLPPAVKRLRSMYGAGFYLSMGPQWGEGGEAERAYGGIQASYLPLVQALREELTVVRTAFYESGDLFTPYDIFGVKAGSAAQQVSTARMMIRGFKYQGATVAGLRPDQVVLSVPTAPRAVSGRMPAYAETARALNCLTYLACGQILPYYHPTGAHAGLRGVTVSSINDDQQRGKSFSAALHSTLATLP